MMATVLWSPTKAFLTLNFTLTRLPSSAVEDTVPTFTPAIRTSSFGPRFASSVKYAVYVVPPPMIGSLAALKAAHRITRISTSPMAPIVVGLRELNGLPPTFVRRVFTGGGGSSSRTGTGESSYLVESLIPGTSRRAAG